MIDNKLLILIVAYNAEETLENIINRIPEKLLDDSTWETEILVIDDASQDNTFHIGKKCQLYNAKVTVLKNPVNQGYGGNQKLGYHYALKHGFSVVALIHGDGQYAPEKLLELISPFADKKYAAVFGTRMGIRGDALKGGMPLYKYIGNKILTLIQNTLAGTNLTEYHSGYRLYSCEALAQIPFELNSNGFDFDTDIILQLHRAKLSIVELPIPTFYGNEICYVNGVQYGIKIITTTLLFALQDKGIFYQPKFDLEEDNTHYTPKFDFCSSHSMALDCVTKGDHVLAIGSGPAVVLKPFTKIAESILAIDCFVEDDLKDIANKTIEVDVKSFDFNSFDASESFSKVLALDIIEHLDDPEMFLEKMRNSDALANTEFMFTTPNVAFFPIRLMLLLGNFSYGKKGILDKTHCRLFTFKSFRQLLEERGFQIIEEKGIPAPFPLALGRNWLSNLLLNINLFATKLSKGMFSYQIFVRARPQPTLAQLMHKTHTYTSELEKGLTDV